jgi:hypothetical protein
MGISAQRIVITTVLVAGALVVIDRVENTSSVPEPGPVADVPVAPTINTSSTSGASLPTSAPAPAPVTVSRNGDVPVAGPAATGSVYALTGTSLSTGGTIGFLREINGDRSWSVRKGDRIGDAIVVDVASDHVTLARGPARQVVSLGDAPVLGTTTISTPATTDMPRLVGGEPADGDSGAEDVPVAPPRRPAAPVPPVITGPAPTLNSIDPPFDPAHQKGESANADDGSD